MDTPATSQKRPAFSTLNAEVRQPTANLTLGASLCLALGLHPNNGVMLLFILFFVLRLRLQKGGHICGTLYTVHVGERMNSPMLYWQSILIWLRKLYGWQNETRWHYATLAGSMKSCGEPTHADRPVHLKITVTNSIIKKYSTLLHRTCVHQR